MPTREPERASICPLCSTPLVPGQGAAMYRDHVVHLSCWHSAQARVLRCVAENDRALQKLWDHPRAEPPTPDLPSR